VTYHQRMRITSFVIASLLVAAPAFADDTESEAPGNHEPSHADPATQTLPATASATAQANAFGQQGARMKAAHAAAKNAAKHEASKAAKEHRDKQAKHNNGHHRGQSKNKGHHGQDD
jgi:hypothetical protein